MLVFLPNMHVPQGLLESSRELLCPNFQSPDSDPLQTLVFCIISSFSQEGTNQSCDQLLIYLA